MPHYNGILLDALKKELGYDGRQGNVQTALMASSKDDFRIADGWRLMVNFQSRLPKKSIFDPT